MNTVLEVWTYNMKKKHRLGREYYLAIISVVFVLLISSINPNFIKISELIDLFKSNAVYFIGAFGVLLVMILGGIDLSIGSMIASIAIIVAQCLKMFNINVWQAFVLACILGVIFGWINGILVSKLNVSSVIITIATMSIYRGMVKYFIQTRYILQLPEGITRFGRLTVAGIPIQIIFIIVIGCVTYFILKYTTMGRGIYAIGGNEKQAIRRGYDKHKITIFTYAYCGLMAGISAFIHLTLIGEAYIEGYAGYEITFIIMLVLGGVSIVGGYGSVKGAIFGVAFIILLKNGFTYIHISVFLHKILIAIVFTILVSYNVIYNKKNEKKYSVEYD